MAEGERQVEPLGFEKANQRPLKFNRRIIENKKDYIDKILFHIKKGICEWYCKLSRLTLNI